MYSVYGTWNRILNEQFVIFTEPTIHFQGDTNQHIKDGSEMTLKCVIKDAIEAPLFVNWFYNQQPIYLPNSLGWQSKIEKVNTNLIDKFDMVSSKFQTLRIVCDVGLSTDCLFDYTIDWEEQLRELHMSAGQQRRNDGGGSCS